MPGIASAWVSRPYPAATTRHTAWTNPVCPEYASPRPGEGTSLRRIHPRLTGRSRPDNEEKQAVTIFRAAAALLLLAAGTAGAQEAPSARVTPLMTQALADYPG